MHRDMFSCASVIALACYFALALLFCTGPVILHWPCYFALAVILHWPVIPAKAGTYLSNQ